jgi:hypothetical protein
MVSKAEPVLFLFPTEDILEGDLIISSEPGFQNKTFRVKFVKVLYDPFTEETDHLEISLESYEKGLGRGP